MSNMVVPKNKRITSADVARFVGVSQATVSRAFSTDLSITDATRAKILDAARRLNYVPNSLARSLITNRSNIVAMLIGDLHNPFYNAALDEFSTKLQALGKSVLVFNLTDTLMVDDTVRRMLEYQIDGLIITAATMSMKVNALCQDRNIPVVMFNRYVPGSTMNCVCCDNIAGGELAAETLIKAGAARFGIIYGDSSSSTNVDRIAGFMGRLLRIGIRDIPKARGHYTYEGGYRAAIRLLNRSDRPEAIFCVNDIMALGAIDAARSLDLRIPTDLMIIGFDDIVEGARAPYQLTTIRQPMRRMVDESMALLSSPGTEACSRILKGTLVTRATTR